MLNPTAVEESKKIRRSRSILELIDAMWKKSPNADRSKRELSGEWI